MRECVLCAPAAASQQRTNTVMSQEMGIGALKSEVRRRAQGLLIDSLVKIQDRYIIMHVCDI